jgi:hypothetical protein
LVQPRRLGAGCDLGERHSVVSKRVDDRIRTGDRLDHNQELYRLSYVHHVASI